MKKKSFILLVRIRYVNPILVDAFGKWPWRYHFEMDALWRKIIVVNDGSMWGDWCSNEVKGAYGVSL